MAMAVVIVKMCNGKYFVREFVSVTEAQNFYAEVKGYPFGWDVWLYT